MLLDGSEYAPLSEGKVDKDTLIFRADTLQCTAVLTNDALNVTMSISHGRTFQVTFHQIAASEVPHPATPTVKPAGASLPLLKPGEIPHDPPRTADTPGTLLLAGGGGNAPALLQRFTQLVSGGSVAGIPTAPGHIHPRGGGV